jgi:glycosyltransferase involved in cell wall biosynthesis
MDKSTPKVARNRCCVVSSTDIAASASRCTTCGFLTCALHATVWTDNKSHCFNCFAPLTDSSEYQRIITVDLRNQSTRRCLIVIDGLYIAGAQKSALFLIRALRNLGFGVHLLTLTGGGQWYDRFAEGCDVISISYTSDIRWNELASMRGFVLPQFVSTHLCEPSFWAANNIPHDIPLIAHLHSELSEHERLAPDESNRLFRRARKIVVPSSATARFYSNWLDKTSGTESRQKITVLPNIVHSSLCAEHQRKMVGRTEKFILFAPTRLDSDKVDLSLLLGFLKALPSYQRVRLVIAGDGEYRQEVEAFILSNNLNSFVTLVGFKTDIDEYYLSSDAVVIFSKREAMPMVFLEALHFNVPFITPKIGVFENMDETESLYIYKPHDIKELLQVVESLINGTQRKSPSHSHALREKFLNDHGYNISVREIYLYEGTSDWQ